MELKSIANYPILFNDSEIKQLRISIKEIEESLKDENEKFQKRVLVLQQLSCDHKFQKIMEFDENYRWGIHSGRSGDDVMKGKECSECGFFIPRPTGSFSKICHKCGGEMEYKGKTPGQGGDGEHIDKCKDCGHTTSHT